jgi:hypothetical protein
LSGSLVSSSKMADGTAKRRMVPFDLLFILRSESSKDCCPEHATGGSTESIAARRRAEEYLLERKLFRRKSTGAVVDPAWLQFSFPTRWHYDVLRGLDYFRAAGDRPDPRVEEAIDLLQSKQQRDGTWLLENTHPGAVHFEFEKGDGRPSRWNTLRALRVLRWHEHEVGRDTPG